MDLKMLSLDTGKIEFQEYHSLTLERRESYLSNINAMMEEAEVETPMMKRKKKKGHHRTSSNVELSQLAVALKTEENCSKKQSILTSRSSKDLMMSLKD